MAQCQACAGWNSSIEQYPNPVLGDRVMDTIGVTDVLAVLSPIWTTKPETARRVKQRLSTIFDWAKGNGFYSAENSVNGVTKSLPKMKLVAKHMPALPWRELPAFMADLGQREGICARTLEFLILTGLRSNEVRGARWEEIDLVAATWTVPATRMKCNVEHRVPLSLEACSVLDAQRGLDPDWIFPSTQRGNTGANRPQSENMFKALLKRMGRTDITPHGFRSTFRDWCGDSARADREVAELALAHAVGNQVERAYARSDLFERRRTLMNAWGAYATGKTGTVTKLARA